MKYFYTNPEGEREEYPLADNETIELGNDGVYRVLVDTGTETYHKPDIVLDAVNDEEKAKAEKEEAEKKKKAEEGRKAKEAKPPAK